MTTIALFGATGRTGRPLLENALARGWNVTALVRDPARLPAIPADSPGRLTTVTGDLQNADAVASVIEGADAVISVIGHVKGSPATLQTDATRFMIEGMHAHGVTRILSLTGGGVPFERDEPKVADRVITWLLRRVSGDILDDALAHAELLKRSELDWTIVRGPRLTDAPRRGQYRLGWVGVNASTSIGRADLADAIVDLVDTDEYRGAMPFVSY